MDYDDDDFQGHNIHLSGEGSSKLSPVLRPYALPKFDFDDSLQGHLRFDSLVENEVFLGIPSQEDNQWIEDFSRGSSGVDFSSSATESCSISRRNNVWSEATSSESVEMLLKSVGQDERNIRETIIEEIDAGNGLCRLTEEMEPSSKQDDTLDNDTYSQSAVPPNGIASVRNKNFLEAQDDVPPIYGSTEADSNVSCSEIVRKVNVVPDRTVGDANHLEVDNSVKRSLADNMKEVSFVSVIHIGNESSPSYNVTACSAELNDQGSKYQSTNACSENVDSLVDNISKGRVDQNILITKTSMVGETCTNNIKDHQSVGDANQMEVDNSVEESLVDNMKEIPFVPGINIGTSSSPHYNVTARSTELDGQGSNYQISYDCSENVDNLAENVSKGRGDQSIQSTESSMGGERCINNMKDHESVGTGSESQVAGKLEIKVSTLEEPSGLPTKGDCDLQIEEESKNGVESAKPSDRYNFEEVCNEGPEISKPLQGSIDEASLEACIRHKSPERDSIEVRNTLTGNSVCPELEIGCVEEKKGNDSDGQVNGVEGKNIKVANTKGESFASQLEVSSMMEKEKFLGCSKMDRSILTESSVLPDIVHNLAEQDDGRGIQHVTDLPQMMTTCSTAGVLREQSSDESLDDAIKTSRDRKEDIIPVVHDSPILLDGSMQLSKKDLSPDLGGGNSHDRDVNSLDKMDAKLPTEFSHSDEFYEENNVRSQGLDFDSSTRSEPESKIVAEDMNLSSHEKLNGLTFLSGTHTSADKDTSHDNGQKAPVGRLSDLKESSPAATNLESVPEGPLSVSGKANHSEQEPVDECSKQLGACPLPVNRTLEHSEGNEAVGHEKREDISTAENAEVASVELAVDSSNINQASVILRSPSKCGVGQMNDEGDVSGNLLKENNESPIVISTTMYTPSEKGQKVLIKETAIDSANQSEATSDADQKVQSVLLHAQNEVRPLAGLSEGETGKGWKSIPTVQVHKISTDDKGSPLISDHSGIDLKIVPEISPENPHAPVEGIAHDGAKVASQRKTRRGSGKASPRNNAKKSSVKETPPVKRSKRAKFLDSPGTGQLVQSEELKPYCDLRQSGTKACGVLPIPISNLPDLNTSVPPASFVQQPFTDLQQVQLRAQIFVYGSLIQESVPDEACMVSAFGPSDGGGRLWEPAWRAYIERVNARKSHSGNLETPTLSRAGSKVTDQHVKHSSCQSKVLSSPAGKGSSNAPLSPVVNSFIPISSPLWNVSTPSHDGFLSRGVSRGTLVDYHQPLSPLHPYQASNIRNFVGHSPSWLSQTPFPGSWVASPQASAFEVSACFSVYPNTEPVKLTPAKVSPLPNFPAAKPVSLPAVNTGATFPSSAPSQPDTEKVTISSSHNSADPKPRKRKKVPVTASAGRISSPALNQTASACAPGSSNHDSEKATVLQSGDHKSLLAQSHQIESETIAAASNNLNTSVSVTTPVHLASTSNSGKYLAAVSPASLSDQYRKLDQNTEKNIIISNEALNSVEEAKLQAEEAAAQAAAAVTHCNDVWSQLEMQKNSGLRFDLEAKLASAAMAIAAAASVAKAAAAAAEIASNVAVQAKLMADEVSISGGSENLTQNTRIFPFNVPNDSRNVSFSSPMLKFESGNVNASSIIAVARGAIKGRVDAASAASKHAENLDAIVKASELAAEAVSHAGKIVSIGDPLPLCKLVESGPTEYWKYSQISSEHGAEKTISTDNRHQPKTVDVEEICNVSAEQSNMGVSSLEAAVKRGTATSLKKDSSRSQRDLKASDFAKTVGVVSESEAGAKSDSVAAEDLYRSSPMTFTEDGLKEGCLVEVLKDGDKCKAAWYSASILNLKDGKAFVCYTELQEDEGSGNLKEWVPLGGDGTKAPVVRCPHPATAMCFDGTRKRRRAAVMDYTWCVGDRVDAWVQDCWREGFVKEKSKIDGTTFTIHFPALGEMSTIRSWHLRPTLIWQDGKWIEWSSARRHSSSEGDTPPEKRVKLASPGLEAKGKDNMSIGVDLLQSKKNEELRLLPLSANEREFHVGKNTRHENKVDAQSQRTLRTGLQKEGSRVVFGVPKPGKKRKFMDVSKHLDSDQSTKNINRSDSVKFARYLMRQGSGSRGWKNFKPEVKEKQGTEDRTNALRSGKPLGAVDRTLPRKNNHTGSSKSKAHDSTITNKIADDAISNENSTDQQNLMEFGSFSDSQDTSEGPNVVSTRGKPQNARRKVPLSSTRTGQLNKGKAVGGRMGRKVEQQDKSFPEVEPRRSIRRIQPTSRLLEGLQSSLMISKMPTVPHDKNQRNQNRSNFKRNLLQMLGS